MIRDRVRKSWIRTHKSYERKASVLLVKYFRDQALKVPYIFLDLENYKQTISNSVKIGGLYDVYFQMYLMIGLLHGEKIGKGINRDLKEFNSIQFQSEYSNGLFRWIIENIGHRIVSVREYYIGVIQRLVAEGFKQGLTTRQLAAWIEDQVYQKGFYRWQALRIARTESSLAANRAAMMAGKTSGIALDKVWISIPDNRVRTLSKGDMFDHRVMDGVLVDQNDFFDVQGEFLEYPSAAVTKTGAKSSGGNVINCRCTAALVPKRDADGRIIRTAGSVRPIQRRIQLPRPREMIFEIAEIVEGEFIPAKTRAEAERRIMALGVKRVDLKGMRTEQFNVVLRTMEEESLFSQIKLKSLKTYRRKSSNAYGLYSPSRQEIRLNLAHMSKHTKDVIVPYLEQIEKYEEMIKKLEGFLQEDLYQTARDKKQINTKIFSLIRRIDKINAKLRVGETARFWSVSESQENALESLRATLIHEMGHYRHYQQLGIKVEYNFDPTLSISEYGRVNFKEYLVEWYAQWRLYGDQGVPSDILTLFKWLAR